MQTKKGSFIESTTNLILGVLIALISQWVIFGFYGLPIDLNVNLQITAWFTLISFVRTYLVRRLFTKLSL